MTDDLSKNRHRFEFDLLLQELRRYLSLFGFSLRTGKKGLKLTDRPETWLYFNYHFSLSLVKSTKAVLVLVGTAIVVAGFCHNLFQETLWMYPEHYGNNPFYPSDSNFQLVKRDESSGLGVITFRFYEAGEIVAALAGEIVTEMTQHTLQIEPGLHLLDLNFCGYFLHSCEPNVHLDMQKMRVVALRPIQPGDHLLMDYAQTEDFLYKQFQCKCGAPQCRGWITGRIEQPDEHDPAYQEYLQTQVVPA